MGYRSRWHGRFIGAVLVAVGLGTNPVAAQTEPGTFSYTVNEPYSLAWYQINPHTSVLWATTCPGDPFWRPGESRSSAGGTRGLAPPRSGTANVKDSVIPLYRRPAARPYCANAVHGSISAEDTVTWRGLKGTISIEPDSLFSGLALRDRTASREIFNTYMWHTISFTIDSLTQIVPGDTMRAVAYGVFHFRDVQAPTTALIQVWREPPGLRVTSRLDMIPVDLVEAYGVSIHPVRLGIQSGGWSMIHFGVDMILNRTP
ncbi:MAG: hypothetical protein EXR93_04805 [Gemmatimonadetes bacterium]|nr:hypothetical protein [Gemmatimonadota bacterium]